MKRINGVESVEKTGEFQFKVSTHKVVEVKKAIFDLSLSENIGIKSIFDEKQNLEDTFKLVTKEVKS